MRKVELRMNEEFNIKQLRKLLKQAAIKNVLF